MYREFHRNESEANMNLTKAPIYHTEEVQQAAVSIFQYLNNDQLNEYLNDPDKLDVIIADLPQTVAMKRDRENVIVKNKSLAEYNVGLQPKFDALKQDVGKSYEEVNTLKMSLGRDVARLESCTGNQSHDTMLAIFQTEAATADEQSEQLADDFCDKKVETETFISEYLTKRTDAYTKKAKIDKLSELLRHQGGSGGGSSTSAPYPTTSQPYAMKGNQPAGGIGVNPSAAYNSQSYPHTQYSGAPQTYNSGMPTPYNR